VKTCPQLAFRLTFPLRVYTRLNNDGNDIPAVMQQSLIGSLNHLNFLVVRYFRVILG